MGATFNFLLILATTLVVALTANPINSENESINKRPFDALTSSGLNNYLLKKRMYDSMANSDSFSDGLYRKRYYDALSHHGMNGLLKRSFDAFSHSNMFDGLYKRNSETGERFGNYLNHYFDALHDGFNGLTKKNE
ncbi:hypothetical protein SNEBB_010007 [Seison nebaliae]|nr:hypothetical protein SNEBB_010007 [Seison nebaliae]